MKCGLKIYLTSPESLFVQSSNYKPWTASLVTCAVTLTVILHISNCSHVNEQVLTALRSSQVFELQILSQPMMDKIPAD